MKTVQRLKYYYRLLGVRGAFCWGLSKVMRIPSSYRFFDAVTQRTLTLRWGTTDAACYEQVILNREYEVDFRDCPSFIVDCGANVGFASLYFHSIFPEAKILAVEPDPSNFKMLVQNTRGITNITPIQAAIWKESTSLQLDNSAGGEWGRRVNSKQTANTSGKFTVAGVTIPQLIREFHFPSIDLLKLDIEGAELELFSGDVKWLDLVGAIAIELHDRFRPGCSDAFDAATPAFTSRRQVGENVFVARPGKFA